MTKDGKIGWGVIGASNIAHEHMIPAIRAQEDSEVVAVTSGSRERGQAYAAENGIPRFHDTLDALLADSAVDAVFIGTINDRHRDQTLQSAAAGKHVLCEKPLALTLEDARSMVDACAAAGVVMGTNHHIRNAATVRALHDAIQAGRIGRPLAARVVQAGFLRPFLHTWRVNNPTAGGGVELDIGVHCADTLRFLLDDELEEVAAFSQSTGLATEGLADHAMALVRMASGLIADLHMGHNMKYSGTSLEVHGTEGSLFARDVLTQLPVGEVILRTAEGEEKLVCGHEPPYQRAVRKFNDAVKGGDGPAASGEDGVRSLAVALAILESAATGRRVAVPRG